MPNNCPIYGSEPIYMVQNPYIWYATKYMVYGQIYGIWPYVRSENCHIYGYGHTTKKSGMIDPCYPVILCGVNQWIALPKDVNLSLFGISIICIVL